MTLTKALIGSNSLATKGMMVLLGSAFIALAAQVSVPMFPVPMTMQTLAIMIVGLTFGSRLGAVTLLAYLAEGASGLPVFAHGASTLAFVGPTAGFLAGFVAMAFLAGLAVEKGIAKGFVGTALTAIVLSAFIYIPGVAWAMWIGEVAGLDAAKWGADSFASIWKWYMSPFLIGDAVKAVIAALVVTGAWKVLDAPKAK
ncbi:MULTISPECIES: biotin transporter BioY [Falsihalocynthiibacter]|uniref:biotin transporter BioY n=1 Tax=Falsihalocynthiibacter TaxID=2854182 RepID=UPI0030020DCC